MTPTSSSTDFRIEQEFISITCFLGAEDHMKVFEHGKVLFFVDFLHALMEYLKTFFLSGLEGINFCNDWEYFIKLRLVVENGSFNSFRIFELLAYKRVPGGNGGSSRHDSSTSLNKSNSNFHHSGIANFFIGWFAENTLFGYFGISHEHLISGNDYIFHDEVAIVFGSIADFGANISHFNAWEGFMSFRISDLDNECLDSIVFVFDDQLGMGDYMSTGQTKVTGPELHPIDAIGVESEGLGLRVIDSSC